MKGLGHQSSGLNLKTKIPAEKIFGRVSSKQSGGNSGLKSQLWNCALPRISPGKCWLERLIVSRFKSRKLRCEHAITCGAAKRFQVSTLEVWMDTSLSGRNQLWNVFCFHLFSMFYVACILFSDYHVFCDWKCNNLVFWSIWECEDNKSMANALGLFLLNRSRSRLNSCHKLWTDPPMSLKLGNCQDGMDVISLALVQPLKILTFRGTSWA